MATKTQPNGAPEKNTPVAMLQYQDIQDDEAAEEDEEEREDCPCFSCQDVLGRDVETVQCDSCDNWYCVACSELRSSRSVKDVYIGNDWTKKQQGEQMIRRVALHAKRKESDGNRDVKTWRRGCKLT